MSNIKNWTLKKYVALKHRDEEGQGLAEYGLILALIAVVAIGALTLMGTQLDTMLRGLSASL